MSEPEGLAHHFSDAAQQRSAASLGMWVFLATEILFFGGLFLGYAVYRSVYPGAFAAGSRHMDVALGSINTGVLLCSSFTMALAVHAAGRGRRRPLAGLLAATILLGAAFLGIKMTEYAHHIAAGLVPGPGFRGEAGASKEMAIFFAFYFGMTGLHALHMVVGIGVLSVLAFLARRGRYSAAYNTPVEVAGLYWHFVDIIWIFLFPLFYLIDLHR